MNMWKRGKGSPGLWRPLFDFGTKAKTQPCFLPQNTIPTVQHGSGGIIFHDHLSVNWVEDRMDGAKYKAILERKLFQSVKSLRLGQRITFLHDNNDT